LNDAPTDQKKFPPTFPPPLSKQLPDGGDFFFPAQPADLLEKFKRKPQGLGISSDGKKSYYGMLKP